MDKLEECILQIRNKIAEANLEIAGEKPISYGFQLVITNRQEFVPVNIYSGKKGISLTIGGSVKSDLRYTVRNLLEQPEQLVSEKNVTKNIELVRPPGFEEISDFDGRWVGTDESGKGDFFGPLVVAAVMVDYAMADKLAAMGVKDSKTLTDEKNTLLAQRIRGECRQYFTELEISPLKYNSLYRQFRNEGKNLNHLLAWGHARVLEDLLAVTPCRFAIADQFSNEKFILSRLMTRGQKIVLVQTHRAERNIAVAAASILARDRFLSRMGELSVRFGIKFPKGASAQVITAARDFAAVHGREALAQVAKLHFKTIEKI